MDFHQVKRSLLITHVGCKKAPKATATLLGIDEICQRLGISRTTFDRWVKNGNKQRTASSTHLLEHGGKEQEGLPRIVELMSLAQDGVAIITFRPPDIRIGNSPKWEIATLKEWLANNMTIQGND